MNILDQIGKKQMDASLAERAIPEFGPGDTLKISAKVVEGTRERIQAFEGVCISRKSGGINSSFTVRKISYGEGVERVFPLYSPRIQSIEVIRRGAVRRAKLYYLRGRTGKAARIAGKDGSHVCFLIASGPLLLNNKCRINSGRKQGGSDVGTENTF